MASVPSATQWGSPAASKRAFLIHGNTSSSHTWESVAQALARAGFLVTAPNLLGHGYRRSNKFRITEFAEDLRPYFANTVYDVIIGHSLGGNVALALMPFLPQDRTTPVILVDPGLELDQHLVESIRKIYTEEIRNVRSIEAQMAENPLWTREEAAYRVLALRMAQSNLVEEVFAQNVPFSFGHLFSTIPPHVRVTVLVSDPELSNICRLEHVPTHPQVQKMLVKGVGHWIQLEKPGVVVNTALASIFKLTKW
ncbi:hypothetical protein HYDPIDRAFT_177195 [Hydnomerulius pinastri MD-312]|uniref:AB hydrolase-1 domain-containing protein n=1 Tax=Hydnomerulius pinastri MD-312 TaxID=994086 RepID=A0A0C9W3V7_9AGAM|nr:hypothetical protein HYDPIDRAFT_177195 [Hydnomerulius pinastri MD-312]